MDFFYNAPSSNLLTAIGLCAACKTIVSSVLGFLENDNHSSYITITVGIVPLKVVLEHMVGASYWITLVTFSLPTGSNLNDLFLLSKNLQAYVLMFSALF